jgi:hypothetical protein
MSQRYTFSSNLSLSNDKWDSHFQKSSKNIRINIFKENTKKGFSVNKNLKNKISGMFMLKKDHQIETLAKKNNCLEIIQPKIDHLKKKKLREKISLQLSNYKFESEIQFEDPNNIIKNIPNNKSFVSPKMVRENSKIIFPKLKLKQRYNSHIPELLHYNLVNCNSIVKTSPICRKNNESAPNILKENIQKQSSTTINILSKLDIMKTFENYLNTTVKIIDSLSGNNSSLFLTSTKEKQINLNKLKETKSSNYYPSSDKRETITKKIVFSNSFIRNSLANKSVFDRK